MSRRRLLLSQASVPVVDDTLYEVDFCETLRVGYAFDEKEDGTWSDADGRWIGRTYATVGMATRCSGMGITSKNGAPIYISPLIKALKVVADDTTEARIIVLDKDWKALYVSEYQKEITLHPQVDNYQQFMVQVYRKSGGMKEGDEYITLECDQECLIPISGAVHTTSGYGAHWISDINNYPFQVQIDTATQDTYFSDAPIYYIEVSGGYKLIMTDTTRHFINRQEKTWTKGTVTIGTVNGKRYIANEEVFTRQQINNWEYYYPVFKWDDRLTTI